MKLLLRALFACSLLFVSNSARADVTACNVPLKESQSAPAIDVIENGTSVDPDILLQQIKNGLDSSVLEPQLSDMYRGTPQPLIAYANIPFPNEGDTVNYVTEMPGTDGLVRARVTNATSPNTAYQMNFSLDTHAALARNALMRRLGYAIPSPKWYANLKIKFAAKADRDNFISDLAGDTATTGLRWVDGTEADVSGDNLTLSFHDIVLEDVFLPVPQMHWGILSSANVASRRSIRGLIVPLTVLDIYESVNVFSWVPAVISNETLSFSRVNADAFKNQTSIGDVKWIAKKMATLTRDDWTAIIQAGHYPPDIQALVVEKVIGRVDQLMKMLKLPFTQIPYNEHVNVGKVVQGKATQEFYPGYAPRFTYGDPLNPLRASELARFFSIDAINGALAYGLTEANQYFQAITVEKYVDQHNQDFLNEIEQHFQNEPNQPFVAPIQVFGGPTVGGNINASRNIVTGTYYGSSGSQVQLVDTISAGVQVAGFFGVAGLGSFGASFGPSVNYTRSYVHVRPLTDITTAFKDNWAHILIPGFMENLTSVLTKGTAAETDTAITNFMAKMTTGETFIVSDGLSSGASVDVQIPLGAQLGLIAPFSNISEDVNASVQYAILSRVTITRTTDGIQVYITRMHSGSFEVEASTSFFIKVVDTTATFSKGHADTKAFIFPDTFTNDTDSAHFKDSMVKLLRWNNPNVMEEDFKPYDLTHDTNGNHFKLNVGPWVWSERQTLHELTITPPIDPAGRYDASAEKRTVLQAETTKISGADYFGFFSSILAKFKSYLAIGTTAQGDDPSSNFLGTSKTLTISTELETTANRSNDPFTKIEQALNGWIKTKDGVIKVINQVQAQLGEYNPAGGLIDASEFSQTKKIEAFTLVWDLIVYEKGTQNIMKLLDVNQTKTVDVQNELIQLMGPAQFQNFCALSHLQPTLQTGPFVNKDAAYTRVESAQGQTTFIGCAPPIMAKIYDLRASMAKHPEMLNNNIHDEKTAKLRVKTTNDIYNNLDGVLSIGDLIKLIGKENSFFQLRISGFRTNDEDADFNSVYFSNTVGLIDQTMLGGPMNDIETTSTISSNEVEARYMSSGY